MLTTMIDAAPAYGTPAWVEWRKQGIGASDAPMACGASEYGGPLDLVRIKLGLDTVEETHAMKRGHIYEPAIAAEFEVLHPEIALRSVPTKVHPDAPWLFASLDRFATTPYGDAAWEAKMVTPYKMDAYGPSGTDQVPDDKLIQTQVQMLVWNLPLAILVVNFGFETREYFIPRDLGIQDQVFSICEDLYTKHIVPRVLPEPTVGMDSYQAIQRTYTLHDDLQVEADEDGAKLIAEFATVNATLKAAEERKDELKAELAKRIGKHYGLDAGALGRVLWPESKGKESLDTDALIRELKVPADVLQKFTRVGQPYRSMRYYPPKKGKR